MQIDLLKDIATSLAGEKAKGIVDLLYGKKNVNEFLIAKKLNVTINQTRNILYRLADEGIVSFVKKKDRKKGGWYTYFWTLNHDKSLYKFEAALLKTIEQLTQQMNHKKNERFFACPNEDSEFNEENALQHSYTCPECGEILQVKDNSKEIQTLEKDVAKSQEILQAVRTEIQIIQEKQGKAQVRRLKAEVKKKKAARAALRKNAGKKPAAPAKKATKKK